MSEPTRATEFAVPLRLSTDEPASDYLPSAFSVLGSTISSDGSRSPEAIDRSQRLPVIDPGAVGASPKPTLSSAAVGEHDRLQLLLCIVMTAHRIADGTDKEELSSVDRTILHCAGLIAQQFADRFDALLGRADTTSSPPPRKRARKNARRTAGETG